METKATRAWFLVLCLAVVWPLFAADQKSYTFGVVPQVSATRLAETWIPLLQELSKESGVDFRFKTAVDIATFDQRVTDQAYDFVYMNPYQYALASDRGQYQAFAHRKENTLQGILVVHKESPVIGLADLNYLHIAFPSPNAFAASMLARALLKKEGIRFTPHYVGSHESVYQVVADGLYPAGGGILRTFNTSDELVRDELRILWKTPLYTPHAFAHNHRVPGEIAGVVTKALLAIDSESHADILEPLGFKGFVMVQDSDWDDVRAIQAFLQTTVSEQR